MVLPVGFMICGVFVVSRSGMIGKGGVLLLIEGGNVAPEEELKQLEVTIRCENI